MAFKMKGSPFQQMESNAQQRKNLMNDNPVDSKASALNKMDPMHNGEPGVQKEDFEQFSSPMNQGYTDRYNKKGESQSDILDKRTANRNNYVTNKHNKTKFTSEGTLASSMKNIANYEKLQKKSQDSINSVNKVIDKKIAKLKNTPKDSPMNQGRKVKKAKKTQAQIDKIRKSFGTKDADVSGRFERKRKKMDKTVGQLEKKGVKVDFDTTSAEGEGASRKTTKKTSYVSVKKKKKDSPMNQGGRKGKKARKTLKQIEEMQDKRETKIRVNSKVSRIVDEGVVSNKEKRKRRKLAKTMKQVKDSSPMNQGKKKIPFIKPKRKISPTTPKAKSMKQRIAEGKQKDDAKKKTPLNNKEERKAKRAKRREETGGTRIGNAIRKGKEVVDKVKNSKVGKVASGIVKTVSNVKSGRIGAAIESGKQTISDAKKKKADSPATMKKSKY